MKLKKTIVFAITAALLLQLMGITTTFAATGDEGDFDWTELSADTIAVTAYTGPGGAVSIPSTMDDKTVVQINDTAFKDKTSITDIFIPASVTTISDSAFSGCANLVSVTFEQGSRLSVIGDNMFYNSGLTSVKIPSSITSIETNAFKSCSSLASVTFDTGSTGRLTSIGDSAFFGTKLSSVRIPASVETIGVDAFKNCADKEGNATLATLTFASGANIATIGSGAFYGSKLTSVSIPATIKTIGAQAFADCPTLEKALIYSDDVTIEAEAFEATNELVIYGPNISTVHDFCNNAPPYGIAFRAIETAVGDTAITAAVSAGTDRVTISWSEAERATQYELWRCGTASGTYTLVTTTAGTSYTNTGLAVNTTYYYKVRGLCKPDGIHPYYGSWSDPMPVKPLPGAPNSAYAVSAGYSSIKISWTPVPGASGYEIYRAYDKIDNSYSLVKTIPNATVTTTRVDPKTYTFTGLTPGRLYCYKVRAYVNIPATTTTTAAKYVGAFSLITSARPTPAKIESFSATVATPTSVKLSWKAVTGRTKYEVWRQGPGGPWEKISETSYNYFTNTKDVFVNQTYSYYIRVYRTVSTSYIQEGRIYGGDSPVIPIKPEVLKVTGVKAARYSSTQINITWPSLAGVSGYELSYATAADGPWTVLQTSSARYYYHRNLTTGTKYYYRVRAYLYTPGGTIYGATYSDTVSNTP